MLLLTMAVLCSSTVLLLTLKDILLKKSFVNIYIKPQIV